MLNGTLARVVNLDYEVMHLVGGWYRWNLMKAYVKG